MDFSEDEAARHSLDDVLAKAGLDRAELELEIAEEMMDRHAGVLRKLAPYDHTFQVTAWKTSWREPYWFLSIECPQWALSDTERGYWATSTPWLCLAEHMAKDYLVGMLRLDYKHWDQIAVNVTRGIGPGYDEQPYRWSSLFWAQWDGVKDSLAFWRVRRDVRRRNR